MTRATPEGRTGSRTPGGSRGALIALVLLVVLAACDSIGVTRIASNAAVPSGLMTASAATASRAPASPEAPVPSTGLTPPTAALGPSLYPSLSLPPSPAVSMSPPPSMPPTPSPAPSPAPGPVAMDLYRPGAFTTEVSKVMCVPAAMQVMVNIMAGTADRTLTTQQRLYALARELSPATLRGDGAEPEGWARGLEQLGFGRFAVRALPTMKAAIDVAAKAIRLTGRPAGILVWYGAHSWVMSGFRATADPALTGRFTVTAVSIEDVWYPKISTLWGRSRPPDSLVPVNRLPRDFLPWRMPGGPYPDKAWKFVVVVPVA